MKIRLFIGCLLEVFLPTVSMAQLELQECRDLARQNYPSIQQLDLLKRTEEFTLKNIAKGYLPQVSFSGKVSYQSDVTKLPIDIPGIDFGMEKDQYQAVLEVNQLIWDGGALRNRKQTASAERAVQRQEVEVGLYTLNDRVDELFFGVLLCDAKLEQNTLLKKQLELNLAQVQACVNEGVANQADLDAVRVEQLGAEQNERELKAFRKTYAGILGWLIGREQLADETFVRPEMPSVGTGENLRPELKLYDLQRSCLEVQRKGLTVQYYPKLGLFAQGAYGDPGLNLLKGGFEFYYIAGIRLTWNFGNLYTLKNDRKLIDLNRRYVDVQQETFLLNNRMEKEQYNRQVEKLRDLMVNDEELIRLRENIRRSAEAKMRNGTLTVTEMLREVIAESQARQTKVLHEIELLQALYDLQCVTNDKL